MAVDQTGRRNKFHVDLDAFTGMVHLLIRFGDIFRVRRMDGHEALFFKETVKAWDRASVAALCKFHPEDDQAGIRIAPAHIGDEFDLLRGMLVRVMVRASGPVPQGFNGAVKTPFPAVDILPVSLIFDSSIRDTILLSIPDKG